MVDQPFNILSRQQDIHQSLVLEASAGTGKTFSIEHLVARLLIELHPKNGGQPLPLEKVLVVTFTRAATSELQQRVRGTLEKCIQVIRTFLREEEADVGPLDFLKAVLDGDRRLVEKAKQNLEHALFCFDEAHIFTIHGFCFRALREAAWEIGMGSGVQGSAESVSPDLFHEAVRDFLRTELTADLVSPSQMATLIRSRPYAPERLLAKLADQASSSIPIERGETFLDLFSQFSHGLVSLAEHFHYDPDQFESDWLQLARSFNKLLGTKSEGLVLEKLHRFSSLLRSGTCSREEFETLIQDGPQIYEALGADKVTKKTQAILQSDEYVSFRTVLEDTVLTPWKKASSKDHVAGCLAYHCQRFLHRIFEVKEWVTPDHVLEKMHAAVQDPAFAASVRQKYQVAIIDEFQDTDPLQWEIFRELFLENDLYLVGDPKQSIYAFRRADIYTYLQAGEDLQGGLRACLDTNFRSAPRLVSGLNALFHPERNPRAIYLPKRKCSLPCQPVNSGAKDLQDLDDGRQPVHFFASTKEESSLFPFLGKEILRLRKDYQLAFRDQAILVRDRHQAEGVMAFLEKHGVPCLSRRGISLVDSPALPALEELLEAVLHPRSTSAVKVALGGRILGWNTHEIQAIEGTEDFSHHVRQFFAFRSRWFEEGFGPFWRDFEKANGEALLQRPDGASLYLALRQLVELLLEREPKVHASPEGVLHELRSLKNLSKQEKEDLRLQQDPTKDAVQVMTMHMSKGLEFGVVYALGVLNHSPALREGQMLLHRGADGERWLVSEEYPEATAKFLEEADAEKGRQLYVAFTRAKYRLYIPMLVAESSKPPKLGAASPLDLFLGQFDQAPTDTQGIYERIASGELTAPLIKFIEEKGEEEGISLEWISEDEKVAISSPSASAQTLVPPPQVTVITHVKKVFSFTALSSPTGDLLSALDPPRDFQHADRTQFTLPAGAETGLLIHGLLENLDFRADERSVQEMVRKRLANTRFEGWEDAVASLLLLAAQTSLDGTFCLADVEPEHMLREMDFLFEDLNAPGYLRGVMDLFFRHDGKYYLLDWKTNWLGPDACHYTPETVADAMRHHDYHLQANIYSRALEKYLKWVEPRPFPECFGGTFYVFLRGPHVFSV